jgi:hypothetical protein
MTQPPYPPAPPPPGGPPGHFGHPGFPGYDPRFPVSPSYEPPPPAAFSRPLGVVLLAVLNGLGALLYLGFGFLLVVGAAAAEGDAAEAGPVLAVIGAVVAIFGAVHMATAVGLFLLKGFGRVLQIIQSALGLLAIPIGTIISAIVLYYMTRPGMALLFSGRAPASMTLEERQTVERDANKGGIVVVIVVVMALLAVPVMGIIAAIAIPGLLRARMSGNEAMAIGRMRGMSSGQAAYSSTHDGRYGTLACLTNPSSCPGEPVDTPYVSGDTEPDGTRSGYRYQLYVPEDGSRYTYFAEPVTPGTTGTRSFCIDQTGTVMEYLEPGAVSAPSTSDAPCPDGGRPVM